MMINRSGNPTLNVFEKPAQWHELADRPGEITRAPARTMTLGGTVIASATLVAICAVTAVLGWQAMTAGLFGVVVNPTLPFFVGLIGGLVLALVITFVPKSAPFLAPLYAILEGAVIAGFSLFIAERWLGGADSPEATGTIFQAAFLTFAIAGAMLLAYGTGIIRGGKIFTAVVITGTMGLMLYFLVLMVGNFMLGANIPNLYASASPLGIGFTAVCLILASMFLVLDFRLIDEGIKRGAPKHMEWYGGFALLVTLVWIYIEVLRLLAKLRSE